MSATYLKYVTFTAIIPVEADHLYNETVKSAMSQLVQRGLQPFEKSPLAPRELKTFLSQCRPGLVAAFAYFNRVTAQNGQPALGADRFWLLAMSNAYTVLGRLNPKGRFRRYDLVEAPPAHHIAAEHGFTASTAHFRNYF